MEQMNRKQVNKADGKFLSEFYFPLVPSGVLKQITVISAQKQLMLPIGRPENIQNTFAFLLRVIY